MTKQQKTVAYVAAGALALYLLYRFYSSRQSAGQSTTTPNTSGTDYATLAGQEQSDAAALQQQNSQLASQEQSDVAALQGSLGSVSSQEQADVSGITGTLSGLTSTIANIPSFAPLEQQIAAIATGEQKMSRVMAPRRGGPFYNYYQRVTGHPPPAHVNASNFIYQAWKSGVGAANLTPTAHPSAPRNTHVAHPNHNHTQQSGVHDKLPKSKTPSRPSKPRHSGRRK